MSISDPKSGGWVTRERLTSTQMNSVRTELLKAVDGTGGGTYTPTAVIAIGGANGLRIEGTGNASRVQYNARDVERKLGANLAVSSDVAVWDRSAGAGHYRPWTHASTATAGSVTWDIPLPPHANTLQSVTVRYDGAASGSLPAVMPTVSVWRRDDDGTETQIGATATDSSANVAAYTVAHNITASSLAHTIDARSYNYFVRITGGTGGGAQTGSVILNVLVNVSCTLQSEW